MKIIIVSDVHLGLSSSKADQFVKLLNNISVDLLILNGDIYDLIVTKPKIDIFSFIRRNEKIKDFVYIYGNHDPLDELKKYFPNENFIEKYEYEDILVMHGHQLMKGFFFNEILAKIRYFIDTTFKINSKAILMKVFGKLTSKIMSKMQGEVVKKYPNKKLILGHTHVPLCNPPKYNSGAMVDSVCTYIEINDDEIFLRKK